MHKPDKQIICAGKEKRTWQEEQPEAAEDDEGNEEGDDNSDEEAAAEARQAMPCREHYCSGHAWMTGVLAAIWVASCPRRCPQALWQPVLPTLQ